ncbi:MAG: hypothetical protein JXR96_23980 [Deltaproteobacteria bacterium]|nr:hypothetical protein [Deltaproteobacteria bacterium]
MKTSSTVVTLVIVGLLSISPAASAQDASLQTAASFHGMSFEGSGMFLLPLGDPLKFGFGFRGACSFALHRGDMTKTSLSFASGYIEHEYRDEEYDLPSTLSIVPLMLGFQQSVGGKVRFHANPMVGPLFVKSKACNEGLCFESNNEIKLGMMVDMGIKANVKDGLTLSFCAGFMMYDLTSFSVPMSITFRFGIGYEI